MSEKKEPIMLLRFEGYSDDTFGEYAAFSYDYDNCASLNPIEFLVIAPDGDKLVVVGQYCPGNAGGWLIGVAPFDPEGNDTPIPTWPMRIERSEETPYSPALIVEAPEGSKLECLTAK